MANSVPPYFIAWNRSSVKEIESIMPPEKPIRKANSILLGFLNYTFY